MVSLALVPLALVTPVAAAASTFVVQAGAGSADNAAQAFQFYPSTLTIDAGDSVTWKDGSGLIHNVSFGTAPATLPPPAPVPGTSFDGTGFVSSGRIHPGAAYTLTFPKAGTYNYVCRLHQPAMKATLVVQPAGTPYPAGQSSYAPSGDPRLPAALAAGQAALAAQKVTSTAAAGGATSYAQNAGFGDGKSFGLLRFGAHQLTVHTGDTVVWTQNDPDEVHTVSFLDNGKDVDFLTDPAAHQPAGGSVYSGSGFFNSGVLMPGKSYALTFNTPGTYAYQCLIHDEIGMKASITVVAGASVAQAPAQIPAQMPATGAGSTGIGMWGGLVVFGLLLSGLGGLGLVTRRA
jgi:plastocyanin